MKIVVSKSTCGEEPQKTNAQQETEPSRNGEESFRQMREGSQLRYSDPLQFEAQTHKEQPVNDSYHVDGEEAEPTSKDSGKKSKLLRWILIGAAALVGIGIAMFFIMRGIIKPASDRSSAAEAGSGESSTAQQTATYQYTPEPTPFDEFTPEPETEPCVDVIFYRAAQVYSVALKLNAPERIADVTFRFRHSLSGDVALEVKLTPEEIASGTYVSDPFDANEFFYEHMQAYPDTVEEPELMMETMYTIRTSEDVKTIVEVTEVEATPWVNVNYDSEEDVGGIVEMMYGTVYPDCFVVRIEEAKTFPLRVVFGDDPEVLQNGDVLITVSVDGALLTGEFDPTAVYFDEYNGERVFYIVFAVPRPESFPEHGTAEILIRQKLTNHDFIHERRKTITY
ncbi:MAG: hypothetical protein IJI34_01095 [Clostridia bacterium]|nr:hypothetical protein [Clostridia bacterium]